MAHTNYREMPSKIRGFEAFTHGSCHSVNNLDKEYVIVSYATPIARAFKVDGQWNCRLNTKKYSQTTSRLQSVIRSAWMLEEVEEVHGDRELY